MVELIRRWWRIRRLFLALLLLVVIVGGSLWWLFQASLPELDGARELAGLSAAVLIERDVAGVARISAASRLDAARASGFVHAQERFFQMDLMRRSAAGELAALFGAKAVPLDEAARLHGFRRHARREVAGLADAEQRLLQAYADGVNQGLAALPVRPFEYLILRTRPQRWSMEDSALVMFAMYLQLQGSGIQREASYGLMQTLLPASLYAFLAPRGGPWDTPLQGEVIAAPPLPSASEINTRPAKSDMAGRTERRTALQRMREPALVTGSNSWAVAGRLTASGAAMLANDMHLAHSVPNIWYRLALSYPQGGQQRQVIGVSLPGLPVMLSGSNGDIAWGFTNSYVDTLDRVVLEAVDGDEHSYQTPAGPRRYQPRLERIEVAAGDPHERRFEDTIWGPVLPPNALGQRHALRWIAYDQGTLNLGMLALETAGSVAEALDIANRAAAPTQNFVVADGDGHIGWTLIGPLPKRVGFDGRTPVSWADGRHRWDGWLPVAEYPRISDPDSGILVTANNRLVGGAELARLGDGGYRSGARARQIVDDLAELAGPATGLVETDMLAVQLDDRALFLQRWRRLMLETLEAGEPQRLDQQVAQLLRGWDGHASVDSVAYRLVREFRDQVARRAFAPLLSEVVDQVPEFDYGDIRFHEVPLWMLVSQRPSHLLSAGHKDWQALLVAAADAAAGQTETLASGTWGARNVVAIQHPFSRVLPLLAPLLDMPTLQLPGDRHMPRIQGRGFGASERLVVSPGGEQRGIFHMPGGQSGHPLSSYYRSGFEDWAKGRPSALLPATPAYRLTLLPPTPQ